MTATVVMLLPEQRARINNARQAIAKAKQTIEVVAQLRGEWCNEADNLRRIRDASTAFSMDCIAMELDRGARALLSVIGSIEMTAADMVRQICAEENRSE